MSRPHLLTSVPLDSNAKIQVASRILVFAAVLYMPRAASAFDPFTVAAGAQAASGIASGLGGASAADDLSSLADSGLAIGDLLSELDVDPTADQETQSAVRKMEELRSIVSDANSTKADLKDILNLDELKAKSFSDKVRTVKRFLQIVKRIGALMGFKPKAAEKAFQIQQTQLSYMMLDELMAMHRGQFNAYLETQSKSVERKALVEKLNSEEKMEREQLMASYRVRGGR
jgi:hypothetical protein